MAVWLCLCGCGPHAYKTSSARAERPDRLIIATEEEKHLDAASPLGGSLIQGNADMGREPGDSPRPSADIDAAMGREVENLPSILEPRVEERQDYTSEETLLAKVASDSLLNSKDPFSLRDAIVYGSRYNLDVKSNLTPYDQSLGQLQASLGQFDTSLEGQASVVRSYQYTKGSPTPRVDSSTYKLGFKTLFTSGILLEMGSQQDGTGSEVSGSRSDYGDEEYYFNLNIPLLKGLGQRYAAATLISAEISSDAALNDVLYQSSVAIGQVAKDYWSYLQNYLLLKATVAAEIDSYEMMTITEQLVARDARPLTELHSLRADWLNKSAERKIQQQSLLESRETLAVSLGLPLHMSTAIPVPSTEFPVVTKEIIANLVSWRKEVIRKAFARRGDYQADKLRLESKSVLEEQARNALLPDLSLQGGVNQWGGGDLNRYTDLSRRDNDAETGYTAGLFLTMPLQNNTAEGELRDKRSQRINAEYTVEQSARTVINQITTALTNLYLTCMALEDEQAALDQHEKAYDDEQAKYMLGISTPTDIINVASQRNAARKTLLNTQLRLANAIVQFHACICLQTLIFYIDIIKDNGLTIHAH